MYRIEAREKKNSKVTLVRYREATKTIFEVFKRFSTVVEKASCDEGFLDITREVQWIYENKLIDYSKQNMWYDSHFMGFKDRNEANFIPESEHEKKLFIASMICKQARSALERETGYKASAGISYTKTVAKIASS